MIHNKVRLAILKKFERQSDFAQVIGENESAVSQVIRGRRKLSKERAEKWGRILQCDSAIFQDVLENGHR